MKQSESVRALFTLFPSAFTQKPLGQDVILPAYATQRATWAATQKNICAHKTKRLILVLSFYMQPNLLFCRCGNILLRVQTPERSFGSVQSQRQTSALSLSEWHASASADTQRRSESERLPRRRSGMSTLSEPVKTGRSNPTVTEKTTT